MFIAAWVVLAFGCLGIASVLLVRLTEVGRVGEKMRLQMATDSLLGYFWHKIIRGLGKLWHHILEAKDLRPSTSKLTIESLGRVKKVFKIRIKQSDREPDFLPEVADSLGEEGKPDGQPQSPEQIYLAAIKKNPNDRHAYEGLGRLYLQEKNYPEAIETFKFLTRLDPKKDIYWSNLGLSLYSTKEHLAAIAAYEKALTINRKVPSRWINLSLCFEALDEHGKAIKAILAALQLDRKNQNYLNLLADIYIKVDNKVRAEEVLQEILTVDPTNKAVQEKLMKVKI